MADQVEEMMDLDLNLGPVAPPSSFLVPGEEPSLRETVGLGSWVEPPFHQSIREALRQRTRQRWRWRHMQLPTLAAHSLRLRVDSDGGDGGFGSGSGSDADDSGVNVTLQTGEGSGAPDERNHEPIKTCENNVTLMVNGSANGKEDVEKTSSEEGSLFDCNICLVLAKEPVVTCCGHLFCWPCIYRWLHVYCDAKECPVCKGEVSLKTVTPIYGRGNQTHEPEDDSDIKVPARPSARRVESLRQTIQRTASSFPMEEMIRRLGARFELSRDLFQLPDADGNRDPLERSSLLNRILTSRALRREQNQSQNQNQTQTETQTETQTQTQNQNPVVSPEIVDLTDDHPEVFRPRRLPPLTYRRGQSYRGSSSAADRYRSGSNLSSLAADRIVEAYLRRSPPARSQESQPPPVDDRDSFSSIAAVIHGESQTVDTAVEIDSLVSLSTSSSRRRRDGSRASDVDSGDSRSLRRRRVN